MAPLDETFVARLAAAHKEIWVAFVTAMQETRCKNAEAARGMRVSANTITNYMKGITPVSIPRALAYPRISKAFRDALCSYDHGPASAPYVAKKRRGAK